VSQETSISTPSSDTTDSGSDDDDFPAIAELRVTPTEAFYNRNNQSMKCLVVLCEGLKDVDGDDLLDIRSSPFSSLKRGDMKPTADMFRDEVIRRQEAKVLEVQIQQMQTMTDSETVTPVRRNRNSTL
jgi:hypothetical protein